MTRVLAARHPRAKCSGVKDRASEIDVDGLASQEILDFARND